MAEPYVPVPDPEPQSNWDPTPARCSIEGCRDILQNPHPASRGDGHWEGFCQFHGVVPASYPASYPSQESEIDEEEV